jgi:hypothetical protein
MLADVKRSLYIVGSKEAQVNTDFYREQVDDCCQDQKEGNPHRSIDILSNRPIQVGFTIVVTKFDCI